MERRPITTGSRAAEAVSRSEAVASGCEPLQPRGSREAPSSVGCLGDIAFVRPGGIAGSPAGLGLCAREGPLQGEPSCVRGEHRDLARARQTFAPRRGARAAKHDRAPGGERRGRARGWPGIARLFRELGDADVVAYSLSALGFALLGQGSETEGERLLEKSLEAAKAVGTGAIRAGRSRVWGSPRCGGETMAPRGAASRRPLRS